MMKNLAKFERKANYWPQEKLNYGRVRTKKERESNMLDNSDIVATMKSRRISWAEHVWRVGNMKLDKS